MLPKIETAILTKTVKLPISGKTVKIRPFLGKEEKLLLMAKESKSHADIISICSDVINACCFNALDVKKLPAPDVEKLFIEIRCLSKGETVDVSYICRADLKNEDGTTRKCNTPVEISVNLADTEIVVPENHKKFINVDGTNYSVELRYPTIEDSISMIDGEDTPVNNDLLFNTVLDLIVSVIDTSTGTVYTDFTREELKEFLENVPFGFLGSIAENFIMTMPTLRKKILFKCTNPECGHTEEIEVKGFKNFF